MKYRLVLKCSAEDIFEGLRTQLMMQYELAKGEKADPNMFVKGFTFDKKAGTGKAPACMKYQQQEWQPIRIATMKIFGYDYPYNYGVEYSSSQYQSTRIVHMKTLDTGELEVMYDFVEKKAYTNDKGEVEFIDKNPDDGKIHKPKRAMVHDFGILVKQAEYAREEEAKKQAIANGEPIPEKKKKFLGLF